MPHALVTTKLRAPPTRPNLVARPRLREALAQGEGRRLTLLLETMETSGEVGEAEKPSILGGVAAMRGWLARLEGDPARAIELSRRAQELLPEDETMLRAFAAFCLGEAYWNAAAGCRRSSRAPERAGGGGAGPDLRRPL